MASMTARDLEKARMYGHDSTAMGRHGVALGMGAVCHPEGCISLGAPRTPGLCEICGHYADQLDPITVEGERLMVCESCSKDCRKDLPCR